MSEVGHLTEVKHTDDMCFTCQNEDCNISRAFSPTPIYKLPNGILDNLWGRVGIFCVVYVITTLLTLMVALRYWT